ncbi:hypothetical protein [Streptomyces salinarius]|uniref:hypothetical protein n=1 Tax=Streptomyces salinarius TaxID=2762598 RepID=UPI0028524A8B|nr:hypothetical protein [Streptomyces salinarius]
MAYNPNTGATTYAGRTYTPVNSLTTRDALRTIREYADADGWPAGHDLTGLLMAVRRFYRLPHTAHTHQIARTVIRGLRAETAGA